MKFWTQRTKLESEKLRFKSFQNHSKWYQTRTAISCGPSIEIHFFYFCVGVWVGGHLPANFSYCSKDAQKASTSFDNNLMGAVGRLKKLYTKYRQKIRFYGGENCGNVILYIFANLIRNYQRKLAPPTHFQKLIENFEIEFPGNWT